MIDNKTLKRKKNIEGWLTLVVLMTVLAAASYTIYYLFHNIDRNSTPESLTIPKQSQPEVVNQVNNSAPMIDQSPSSDSAISDSAITIETIEQPEIVTKEPEAPIQVKQTNKEKPIQTNPVKISQTGLLKKGIDLYTAGDFKKAIDVFDKAKLENPLKASQCDYYIARATTRLYVAGKVNGRITMDAWFKVKDAWSKGSKPYHEADSILALMGAN